MSRVTHGHTVGGFSAEYQAWLNMRNRCYSASSVSYPHYGAKGVKVCKRWQIFENFLADMGLRPDGMSLDRIDNTKDYSPENCRWATRKTQARNTTRNVFIEIGSEIKTTAEWCEQYCINPKTVRKRLQLGWDPVRAITQPVGV